MLGCRCLGKFLRGSRAENIWIQHLVFGINVVQSVLGGTHYTRSLKGMLLLCEAMQRPQWCEFFKVYDCEKYQQQFSLLKELKASIATQGEVLAILIYGGVHMKGQIQTQNYGSL